MPKASSSGSVSRGTLVFFLPGLLRQKTGKTAPMGTSPYRRNRDNAPFSCWPALGHTEDVQMLLHFGADPTLLDRHSRSAVDVLKRNKNFKAIKIINRHLGKLAACSKDLSGTDSSELTFFGRGHKAASGILDTNQFIFSGL